MQLTVVKPEAGSYLDRAIVRGNEDFKSGAGALAGRPLLARVGAAVPAVGALAVGGLGGLVATPAYMAERVATKSFIGTLINFVGAGAFGAAAVGSLAALANQYVGASLPVLSLADGVQYSAGALALVTAGSVAIESISAYAGIAAGKTMSLVARGFDRLGIAAKKPQA